MWHLVATREKDPDPGNLDNAVAIIQAAFSGGRTCGSMRIEDGGGDPQGGESPTSEGLAVWRFCGMK